LLINVNLSRSFGLHAASVSDPHTVCLAAKGQTMRLAIVPEAKVALWGSEGTAIDVAVPGHASAHRYALRLDSVKGQIVQIKCRYPLTPSAGPTNLSSLEATGPTTVTCGHFAVQSFELSRDQLNSGSDLKVMFRYVPASVETSQEVHKDAILADLRAIPKVLNNIVFNWRDDLFNGSSPNRRTAATFAAKLTRASTQAESKLHLLVVGIEVSLYVAEQFALDVTEYIPGIIAAAVSSNQLVGGGKVRATIRPSL
jgi:hypothetical protein